MPYKEKKGDLVKLAMYAQFDVIAHGCNCFCVQKKGIAKQMSSIFGTADPDNYPGEHIKYRGEINKLGTIEWHLNNAFNVTVVNAYTQYRYGQKKGESPPIDYSALILCLKKINHIFKGFRVGLPRIGAGEGGGEWYSIRRIIQKYVPDCDVTVIEYEPGD